MYQWIPGSFFDHLDKFANSLGYDSADIAITLAMVPWESTDERDAFIESITGKPAVGDSGAKLSFKKGGAV